MEKEELVNIVKEWVTLDNEIRLLDREIKERKAKRKQMSDLLVNKKYLTECLGEYFKNDSEQVDNVINHIMESRKIDIKDVLMRKFSK